MRNLRYGNFLPVLLCCFWSAPLWSQTLIINNPTAPPLTTPAQDGFLDIIVSEAFQQVGLQLKLNEVPAERALRNVNDAIDDGDLSRVAGLEKVYPNLVRVPEKLFDMDFVAFSRKKNITIKNWDSLKPYSIGLIKGWKILETGTQNLPNVTAVRNAEVLFAMLDRNRIDVVLYSRWMGLSLVMSKNLQDVDVIEPPLVRKEMFLYLHNKHRNLVPKIALAIRNVKNSGMYDRVFKEKVINKTANKK